jgi:nondiscriminating glutamyl-tRNA synthetase
VNTVKTRFAPSPTGLLHLGNVRTALFNLLYARHCGGVFLLRIEDTDSERSRREYTEQLYADLRWLGLDWDEGPGSGDVHSPYAQSQRGEIYAHYYAELERQGAVYPCFCSARELEISRKLQRAAGQAPRYSGTCAELSAAEIVAKRAQGLEPTLRFRVPRGERVVFQDLVRGEQNFACDDIGDFIIRRADGTPAFFFCNALDDALMEVSHVLRGEDHLTNTPRQLLLLQRLGLTPPAYGHISMIVGADNTPLSKRHGSQSLKDLRTDGWLPAGLQNYLARLGHSYSEDGFMDMAQLAQNFSLGRLGRAPARFDPQQMQYWQHNAVARADVETLAQWPGVAELPSPLREDLVRTVQANVIFPADLQAWRERLLAPLPDYSDDARAEIRAAGAEFFAHAIIAADSAGTDWKMLSESVKNLSAKKGKALFMPLRAALTGLTHGPEMPPLLALLGEDKVRARLREAQKITHED